MINKIELKNFKAHKHSCIKFCPGVNVITGTSQAGKSNVLQALQLVLENRPSGFKYHSNFAEENDPTEITIHCDRKKIKFKKTKTEATYKIKDKAFKKVGKNVPEEISSTLNMSDINFQHQDYPIYLINSSPGEIARTINKITHLDKVDDWVSTLTVDINMLNREAKQIGEEIESADEELKKYEGINEVEELVEKIESLENNVNKLRKEEEGIAGLCSQINHKRNYITTLKKALGAEEHIKTAQKIEEKIKVVNDKKTLLNDYLKAKKDAERLKKYDITQEIKRIEKLETDYNKLLEQENLLIDYANKNKERNELKEKFEKSLNKYIDVLEKEKQCPTCLTTIDSEAVKRIAKELKK